MFSDLEISEFFFFVESLDGSEDFWEVWRVIESKI